MEITFVSHVATIGGVKEPGDYDERFHDATGRALVDCGMAVEGKLAKTKLKALLAERAEKRAERDAQAVERLEAKAERLIDAGAPDADVDRVLDKAEKERAKAAKSKSAEAESEDDEGEDDS